MTAAVAVDGYFQAPRATSVPTGILARNGMRRDIAQVRYIDDGAALLDSVGTRMTFERGQTILFEGDAAESYYRVLSGAVVLYKLLVDGRRQITDFRVTGDLFGFSDGEDYAFSAEAVGEVVVVSYPRRTVDGLVQSSPGLARWLFNAACRDLSAAQRQIVLLGRKTAMERIASFLLAYARRQQRTGDRTEPLNLPMRRVDIADYLGLTLETVSRTFSALKDEGIIELPRHDQVTFRDREALEQLAESA